MDEPAVAAMAGCRPQPQLRSKGKQQVVIVAYYQMTGHEYPVESGLSEC